MRRVAVAVGLVVLIVAAAYTLVPFSRDAPRSARTGAIIREYSPTDWGGGPKVETRCSNAWASGDGWCGTTATDRRTTAAVVAGAAILSVALLVIVAPRRRRDPQAPVAAPA